MSFIKYKTEDGEIFSPINQVKYIKFAEDGTVTFEIDGKVYELNNSNYKFIDNNVALITFLECRKSSKEEINEVKRREVVITRRNSKRTVVIDDDIETSRGLVSNACTSYPVTKFDPPSTSVNIEKRKAENKTTSNPKKSEMKKAVHTAYVYTPLPEIDMKVPTFQMAY